MLALWLCPGRLPVSCSSGSRPTGRRTPPTSLRSAAVMFLTSGWTGSCWNRAAPRLMPPAEMVQPQRTGPSPRTLECLPVRSFPFPGTMFDLTRHTRLLKLLSLLDRATAFLLRRNAGRQDADRRLAEFYARAWKEAADALGASSEPLGQGVFEIRLDGRR